MRSTSISDICVKRAIKAFIRTYPHVKLHEKPLANEELDF